MTLLEHYFGILLIGIMIGFFIGRESAPQPDLNELARQLRADFLDGMMRQHTTQTPENNHARRDQPEPTDGH